MSPDALANFGRYEILGPDLGPTVPAGGGLELVRSLFDAMFQGDGRVGVAQELRRHAAYGGWTAIGAWRFARDFFDGGSEYEEFQRIGLQALHEMRILNLDIHLAPVDRGPYEALFGPPSNARFFGPPVFDSPFGPSIHFYVNQAVTAAASRRPIRVAHNPATQPADVPQLGGAMWNLGLLVFRGPMLVPMDLRLEAAVVRDAVASARDVDHMAFARRLANEILSAPERPKLWPCLGAARFIEDYLARDVTGTDVHLALIDEGLADLRDPQWGLAARTVIEVLSPLERERWVLASSSGSTGD